MKIFELCLSLGIGGLEMYMIKYCMALCDKNTVIAVIAGDGMVHDSLKKHGFCPRVMRSLSCKPPLYSVYKLIRCIANESIDIIHIHWNQDLPLGWHWLNVSPPEAPA